MNAKHIQGCGVLIVVLILALTAFACGQPGGGDGQGEATQSSAVESTELSGTESSVDEDQTSTSQSPGEQTTAQAGSTTTAETSAGNLSSYRIHTAWRDGSDQGPIKDEWTTEYVADPLAVHHKAGGDMEMEMIFVGTTLWTRFMDQPWNQADLPEGQTTDWASMISLGKSPVNVEKQTPTENDIQWLMGQPEIRIAEGSLTAAGQETVNGVDCKRYTVDSTFAYSVTLQQPARASATITEVTQGELWVAGQGGWPHFVVRAQLMQATTTEIAGGASSTETVYIEEDVTDIDSSDIVIEPPQ